MTRTIGSATTGPATTSATPVSPSMVLAMVDEARAKRYDEGVIGLRGLPDRAAAADLQHDGLLVRVRPAESSLAVREALTEHREGDWLVVVTDRDDDDLGAGILAHFVWQRLRSPDPWEAVQRRFAASGIDGTLTTSPSHRELAAALLAATPPGGWPAAPAGVLTRGHALGSVATAHLGFPGEATDVLGVLRWAMSAGSVVALADLRSHVGDLLADTTLDWIAGRAGAAAAPVRALLARGALTDVVPLGIVLDLLTRVSGDAATQHQAQLAQVRLEPRWGGNPPSPAALAALGAATRTLVDDLAHDRRADADLEPALARADALLAELQAHALARHSDLLASGLRARFVVLAEALRRAVGGPGAGTEERAAAMATVESTWTAIGNHRLNGTSALCEPFAAAVRLARWLGGPERDRDSSGSRGPAAVLGALARDHVDVGSWVDAAVNDAFQGTDDRELSPALKTVVDAAQARRRRQERVFADALAAATSSGVTNQDGVPSEAGTVWYLERLMRAVVLPMARRTPVLLVVLDGMSVSAANEILHDAVDRLQWLEAALPGVTSRRRAAALSVLPSLTSVSRTSLLCGRLVTGQQSTERTGYEQVTSGVGKIRGALFHKKTLDTTDAGWSMSHDVGHALNDPELALVTVVLNTVDDALDRSDPGNTIWTAAEVRHLEPLLARAATAGRTVVITADHGHIVERRQGEQTSRPPISSGRSRAAQGEVHEGEVEVRGDRVLTEDHRAILAVDDTLRYGPLKAGYHGGASAAEVVVPVAVLVREHHNPLDLELLPPQQPGWWEAPSGAVPAPVSAPPPTRSGRKAAAEPSGPALFDLEPAAQPEAARTSSTGLGSAVTASATYRAQRAVAGRVMVSDEQVARLVDALTAANGSRLPSPLAAQALGVAETRLRGALTQVQQLLNVEGYAVLAVEAATVTPMLDVGLLREQFGVNG